MFDLKGKVALVTGSSRGIGKAIAMGLAKAGADVIVHGRSNSEALKNTVSEIEAMGNKVYCVFADTAVPEQIYDMFEKIKTEIGKLDILVNNAAVLSRQPILDLELSEWDRLMNTNSRGYFLCSKCAAKIMKENNYGRIINVSSISQYEAAPGRMHYCASKAAIGMLTKCLALELAKFGITANEVLSDKEFYQNCINGIPMRRIGKPQEIAGAVVMLASDEASYISGAEIVIDGAKTV